MQRLSCLAACLVRPSMRLRTRVAMPVRLASSVPSDNLIKAVLGDDPTAALKPADGATTPSTEAAIALAQSIMGTKNDIWLREIANQTRSEDFVAVREKDPHHRAYIQATMNNTRVTGGAGFKGSKKSTPLAAQTCAERASQAARAKGVSSVRILLKGFGPGRASALKGLHLSGMSIISISDITPVPHNGCRPKKARRV